MGFAAERELPIITKIALGSLRNKVFILLPSTMALSIFVPWLIMPLLMLGGAYLCYEGAEKVLEAVCPHRAREHEGKLSTVSIDPQALEDEKVAGAIKTDFILSAEIMAITLAEVHDANVVMQAAVLALVGMGITAAVYGLVAILVKVDDLGVALTKHDGNSIVSGLSRKLGRALVLRMPGLLMVLGAVGTAAMIWVGGGIIVHGLEMYGAGSIGHAINHAGEFASQELPVVGEGAKWAVVTFLSALFGLSIGAVLIPLVGLLFGLLRGSLRS
jgi:hypothetical protein